MARRACPCGVVGCKRHGRRTPDPGYQAAWGAEHQHRRAAMLAGIKAGRIPAVCGRCGCGPRLNDPWEAGHVQAVALGGGPEVRPEHRSCNRRHGAQLRAAIKRRAIEEQWAQRYEDTMRAIR